MTALPLDPEPIVLALDPAAAAKADRLAAFDAEEARLGKEVARKAKIARDDDFFHRTPKWLIPTGAEQAAKRKEAEAYEVDLANVLRLGVPLDQLPDPISNRAKEIIKIAKRRLADKARRAKKREQA